MRRILVDIGRRKRTSKREGEVRRVDFNEALAISTESGTDILDLDDALRALEKFDARKARVVELRYFVNLTAKEIAHVLGVSKQTVDLDWSLAKAWLLREMNEKSKSPTTDRIHRHSGSVTQGQPEPGSEDGGSES
jgi:RNA polymerase sigma factor (TIGR02999 family)